MSDYFKTLRLAWIQDMLRVYGFINSTHLHRKFEISIPQAKLDLRDYSQLHPTHMVYDDKIKAWKKTRL